MIQYTHDHLTAIEFTRRTAAKALREDKTEARMLHMVRALHRQVDEAIDAFFLTVPPMKRPCCARGCVFCCYLQVEVMMPELLMIAKRVKALPRNLREMVRASVRASVSRVRSLNVHDPGERVVEKIPCPFLQMGACAIYDVRPLACRRFYVVDRAFCEKAFGVVDAEVPVIAEPYILPAAAQAGLNLALADVGLFGGHVELITAFSEIDAAENAFQDYRRGRTFGTVIDDVTILKGFLEEERARRCAQDLISVSEER